LPDECLALRTVDDLQTAFGSPPPAATFQTLDRYGADAVPRSSAFLMDQVTTVGPILRHRRFAGDPYNRDLAIQPLDPQRQLDGLEGVRKRPSLPLEIDAKVHSRRGTFDSSVACRPALERRVPSSAAERKRGSVVHWVRGVGEAASCQRE
jgi:hypothetical protein